jgi:hypothetical protein
MGGGRLTGWLGWRMVERRIGGRTSVGYSPRCCLLPSYTTKNIPAYGASRNAVAVNPWNNILGPSRASEITAWGMLLYE